MYLLNLDAFITRPYLRRAAGPHGPRLMLTGGAASLHAIVHLEARAVVAVIVHHSDVVFVTRVDAQQRQRHLVAGLVAAHGAIGVQLFGCHFTEIPNNLHVTHFKY